ncbi:MAG TPA: hypothetical protein VLX92_32495 [Kofleriaceae bacterium]|nr:hypothetical protein [Kofleriaceae bacterium]
MSGTVMCGALAWRSKPGSARTRAAASRALHGLPLGIADASIERVRHARREQLAQRADRRRLARRRDRIEQLRRLRLRDRRGVADRGRAARRERAVVERGQLGEVRDARGRMRGRRRPRLDARQLREEVRDRQRARHRIERHRLRGELIAGLARRDRSLERRDLGRHRLHAVGDPLHALERRPERAERQPGQRLLARRRLGVIARGLRAVGRALVVQHARYTA